MLMQSKSFKQRLIRCDKIEGNVPRLKQNTSVVLKSECRIRNRIKHKIQVTYLDVSECGCVT